MKMNESETKIMKFYKGSLSNAHKDALFYANGIELEEVKYFDYLGITFTPKLSYSRHIEKINARARARIGQIFAKTPVQNTTLELAIKLFNVYILPMYEYGAAIWTTNVSKEAKKGINRAFLKYLKRYLGVPKSSCTDMTYFMTGTCPLTEKLFENPTKALQSIDLSIELTGHQLVLIKNKPQPEEPYKAEEEVPKEFLEKWESKRIHRLTSNFSYRKKLAYELFDLSHKANCKITTFHNHPIPEECKCVICDKNMEMYHVCSPS